jgi:hypothetical protein
MSNKSDQIDLSILGEKNAGRYRCPICDARRGVSVNTRKDGKLLVHCHAQGCDVWSVLRKSGTAPRVRLNKPDDTDDKAKRIREAEAIWKQACETDDAPTEYSVMPSRFLRIWRIG